MNLEQASLKVLERLDGDNDGYILVDDFPEVRFPIIQKGLPQKNSGDNTGNSSNKLKHALAAGLVAIGTLGMAGCISFGDNSDNITDFDDSANSNPPDNYTDAGIVPGNRVYMINGSPVYNYPEAEIIFDEGKTPISCDYLGQNIQKVLLCSEPESRENLTYLIEKIGMDYAKELPSYLKYLTDKGPVTKEWIDQNMEIYRGILIIEEERESFNRLEHVKGYLDILEENGFNIDATNIIIIRPDPIFPLMGGGGFITLQDIVIWDRRYPGPSDPDDIEYNEEVFIPCVLVHENKHNEGYVHEIEGHDEIIINAEKECVKTLEKVFNEKYQIG